uniref:Elongation of very long chain fatty acids protein n=1 Tax=Toxocara canis TaxID=6265 RepID=A0A183U1T4_TOXCA
LLTEGIYPSLCYSVHPNDVAAYWSLLFAISKVAELGDTLFVVLRKKPLIFLHYYHHAAVLIYTAHSGSFRAENTAAGRAFISMNLFAHSAMYTYYACTAMGNRPPKWISMTVTTVQTLQMLTGVAISTYIYEIKIEQRLPCQQSMSNLCLAFIIYITFAVLFIQFFINSYMLRSKMIKKND